MFRYAGPFLFLASILFFYYAAGPVAPLATVGFLLAALVGAEFLSARGHVLTKGDNPFGYRVLLYLYVPLQLCVTIWAIGVMAQTSIMGAVSLILSVGVTAGVFGMLAAHELIHSKNRGERLLGAAMLSALSYRHFRIAHLHGHHLWAGTERDSATARLGESFYAFLPRTLAGQFIEAYRFERRRCHVRGLTPLANRVIQDVVVMMLLFGLIAYSAGVTGLIFFVAQSAVAILVLEMFNYIAHYGLVRRQIATGRWERLSDQHSWNSSNVAANLLIFNMGRHSYHHRKPAASYESLHYLDDAPELPAGYAASILLALIPPLWRRLMDPRARRVRHAGREDVGSVAPQARVLATSVTGPNRS